MLPKIKHALKIHKSKCITASTSSNLFVTSQKNKNTTIISKPKINGTLKLTHLKGIFETMFKFSVSSKTKRMAIRHCVKKDLLCFFK